MLISNVSVLRRNPALYFAATLTFGLIVWKLFDEADPLIPNDNQLMSFLSVSKPDCPSREKCKPILQLRNYLKQSEISKRDVQDFARVLLIISINEPQHFDTIALNYRLYHGIFFKIVFCVANIAQLASYQNGHYARMINISVVEWSREPSDPNGETFYNCVPAVLDGVSGIRELVKRKYIEGFLLITDDLVANLWTFTRKEHQLDKNWLSSPKISNFIIECSKENRNDCLNILDSEPDEWKLYRPRARAALDDTEARFPNFQKNLARFVNVERRAIHNIWADLFYVSSNSLLEVAEIFKIWVKHKVHVELAVGSVIESVSRNEASIIRVHKRGQVGYAQRKLPVVSLYRPQTHLFHPLKLSNFQNTTIDIQCLYCQLGSYFDWLRIND